MILENGKNFGADEKVMILYAIKNAKDYYTKVSTTQSQYRASCALLHEGILAYLSRKYAGQVPIKDIRILSEQFFNKLKLHYHNIKYYRSKGLTTYDALFWWSLHDKHSRLIALVLLANAIIND